MKGIIKVFEIIHDTVEKEYTDGGPLKSRLMEISAMFDNNEITQEEYDAEEKKILERLQEIRNYIKEHYGEEDEDVNDEEEDDDDDEEDYEVQILENKP